jgi:internalin A
VFRYALLHDGLIRTIMAEIGEAAGPDALYWKGGLCGFEARTGSRLLIEQEMTGPWQGGIRVRTQRGQATVLLDQLVKMVERVQARLGMQPTAVFLPSPASEKREEAPMEFRQEKPATREWYVSYAWGEDRTPEGREREQVVDDLCIAAEGRGLHIQRDKEVLSFGDSISAFMRRIGAGDRIFVILSDKYLRSPHCMFELSEIWRTSRQQGDAFIERVCIYALPDAKIWDPLDWADWAIYWKEQHDALNDRTRQHGATILGERGQRRLTDMQRFYTQVADLLGTIADHVQPRSLDELKQHGFNNIPN